MNFNSNGGNFLVLKKNAGFSSVWTQHAVGGTRSRRNDLRESQLSEFVVTYSNSADLHIETSDKNLTEMTHLQVLSMSAP